MLLLPDAAKPVPRIENRGCGPDTPRDWVVTYTERGVNIMKEIRIGIIGQGITAQ